MADGLGAIQLTCKAVDKVVDSNFNPLFSFGRTISLRKRAVNYGVGRNIAVSRDS